MSEALPETNVFRMETDVIPEGVNITLAGRRSSLIEQWRNGELDAESAYTALEHLYWQSQPTADDETRFYLRESSYQFPVEAGMDEHIVGSIFKRVQEAY